jgi:hypothetical protein
LDDFVRFVEACWQVDQPTLDVDTL